MTIEDYRRSATEYIAALVAVHEFVEHTNEVPSTFNELYQKQVNLTKIYEDVVTLFAAVILHPTLFHNVCGVINEDVSLMIDLHPILWDDMNTFYRDFMGLDVNLADR